MADLNLDINYFDHLKTKKLIARLGIGAEVFPIKLWCYTGQHYAKDGKLTGHSAEDIEAAIGWAGESGACTAAFVDFRLLDFKGGKYKVHNWLTRSGHLSAFSERASNAANERWRRAREAKSGDAKAMLEHTQASPSNAPTHPPYHTHVPYPPNQPNPPTPANGRGAAAHGAGVGSNGRGGSTKVQAELARLKDLDSGNLAEPARQAAVTALLDSIGVRPEVVPRIATQRNATVDRINREVADIRASGNASDVAAVLVSRLTPKRKMNK